MARPKGSHDIAPQVRGAWLRACKIVADRGQPLSSLIADAIERDVLQAMNTVSKFLPKEHNVSVEGEINLIGVLTSLAEGRRDELERGVVVDHDPEPKGLPEPVGDVLARGLAEHVSGSLERLDSKQADGNGGT